MMTTTCQWFLMCDNDAVGTIPHPALGAVPVCQRCADKVAHLGGEAMTPLIVTADGYIVGLGSRVFNYYDGCWGVIERVDPDPQPDTMIGQTVSTPREEWANYWFHLDNGDYLDGSRISTYEPKR